VSRPILIAALAFLLFLAGLATLRGELLALSILILVYLLYTLWQAPSNIELDIQRSLSTGRAPAETPVEVSLFITNRGRSQAELLVEDRLPVGLVLIKGSARRMLTLSSGQTYTMKYSVTGSRGTYTFNAVRIESSDPLGLFRRTAEIQAAGQFVVHPRIVRLGSIAIRPRRTRIYPGSIPARLGGPGIEFFGVRDHRGSDPPRAINWRATARHAAGWYAITPEAGKFHPGLEFISNEFQQERIADVGLVLDGRERTNLFNGGSLLENSIEASAALATAFLNQGNRVGLLVYGSYLDWTYPGYGRLQRERIYQTLARARLGDSSVFGGLEGISARMLPVESQIILVSPLANDDRKVLVQLRARGYQVMVVSPDPLAFEVNLLPKTDTLEIALRVARLERRLTIRQLQRAGIPVISWDVAMPFDQAVRPLLMRYKPSGYLGFMP